MLFLRSLSRVRHPIKLKKYLFNKIYMIDRSIHSLHSNVNNETNNTVREIMEYWHRRFKDENIIEPLESIQHILSHVLNITKSLELTYSYDRRLSEAEMKDLETLCLCRLSRMPIQYLLGEWTFRNIVIKLVPPIFIPRPETEVLVDFVVEEIMNRDNAKDLPINFLEIGCGSGAISLATLHSCKNRAKLHCTAIDKNPDACKITKENAEKLGFSEDTISILNASIEDDGKIVLATGQPLIGFLRPQFDVIVSNPPYIPTRYIAGLQSEIKIYEDINALNGGVDGLDIIKSIVKYASIGLKPAGYLFMEIDPAQPKSIQSFIEKFADTDLKYENTYKDYSNRDRYVKIRKIGPSLPC